VKWRAGSRFGRRRSGVGLTGIVVCAAAVLLAGPATTPGSGASTGPVDLPLRTWIGRALPGYDKGPYPSGGETKHLRLAHSTADGRIYVAGGDFSSASPRTSQNAVWSYSIASDDWRLEYPEVAPPYCGPPGTVQANTPDEVVWVWDSNRRVFWLWHGLEGLIELRNTPCEGPGAVLKAGFLQFDPSRPVAERWRLVRDGMLAVGLFGVFDPVTDSIYTFGDEQYAVLKLKTLEVERVAWTTTGREGGVLHGSASLKAEYAAIDVAGRAIYLLAPTGYYDAAGNLQGYKRRLWRFRIDGRRFERLSDPPEGPGGIDIINVFWDSASRVLLWPVYPDHKGWPLGLHIYNPSTNSWERDGMRQADGQRLLLRGNGGVYDPWQNALLFGGSVFNPPSVGRQTHVFLYRYGEGRAR
jgi:hypothetical protein